MKLPSGLSQMFEKHSEKKELFVSLLLFVDGVVGSIWQVGQKGEPETRATATQTVAADTWEDRTEAADDVIAKLEEKAGTTDFHKVTLGLPAAYLTQAGEITREARGHIKKLTKVLELTPMGFVSIYQALVYALKKEEGVPPSVILIGVESRTMTVAVYKVGSLVGITIGEKSDEMALQIEEALKNFQDLEVLPSRMLLYGASGELCEEVKGKLLQHPWPTRANFLHFPKIEHVSEKQLSEAVSLAGASELGAAIGEGEEEKEQRVESKEKREEEVAPSVEPDRNDKPELEEEANVVMVTPEELGFRKQDVLEKPSAISHQPSERIKEEIEEEIASPREAGSRNDRAFPIKIPKVSLPKLPALKLPRFFVPLRGGIGVVAGLAIVTIGIFGFLYWKLPSAVVTIYEIPQSLSDTADVVIDPTATVVDPTNRIIPGKKQEKSVSGQKSTPVTGKKEIGDPAKGAVIIYNKSLTSRMFKKGSVLVANALRFTLDSDVNVASASESLASGSITFGKATGSITAEAIGATGNLPAATEFAFKDISISIAVARNDQALTGGTSREVTVVSRSDMDNFVKAITK
ncbi:baseplate J/gp47 family protein, partial [Candidatus Gottesmanbacteria bacterium]|nr:baseplate J/gp47 family protein [Candidatus Gottesmanbacteria bacterium]